ncbi:MAG: hypothetical protein A3F77_12925 [Betaproteobacteria bacterium RIFCSPLOWO2_12_FULL_67_28]|nr:MAG: hypothetical protein A3I65_10420 [Betaproteobacteria bacterium RIFCSPLOWO2_02_FULL_68_150]OGA55971.1 MAG: hypothetical protein A3F77_12925 [Betaproteobacteria bacterium RIFCSPLOWO2_12_FULL_67_28]
MNRRDALLALSALGFAGVAPRASAQAAKSGSPRKIGILVLGVAPKTPVAQRSTSIRLRKLGWIEGENLIVERAYADLKVERLAGLAEELLRRGVELILTFGPEASLAAARATTTIPIVFVVVTWPVEQGLIDSFARPGRNLTGTSFYTGIEVTNKRLEFLREVAPAHRGVCTAPPPADGLSLARKRRGRRATVLRAAAIGACGHG